MSNATIMTIAVMILIAFLLLGSYYVIEIIERRRGSIWFYVLLTFLANQLVTHFDLRTVVMVLDLVDGFLLGLIIKHWFSKLTDTFDVVK